MAADKSYTIHPGRLGLNFRDPPAVLSSDELFDALNWRISARGSLVKRLGSSAFSVTLPSPALRLGVYAPFNAGPFVIAYCQDGSVQQTDDGSSWLQIVNGLANVAPSFAQYQDKLYIANGVDGLVEWDNSTATVLPTVNVNDVQTLTITGTPTGGTFTLTLNGETTGTIAFNASTTTTQNALVALPSVDSGDVLVTGTTLPGGTQTITFAGGALAHRPITLMTSTDSLTGGTAPETVLVHTTAGENAVPVGEYLAVWRNRLWIGQQTERKVWWSTPGDPTDWTNQLNFVGFPNAPLTGIATSGLRSVSSQVAFSSDGGDGVLVFCRDQTYRIFDDSDNGGDITTGGSNVTIDPGRGCVAPRSIATGNGRVYAVCADGVYSTDGHTPLVLESKMITPLFTGNILSESDIEDMDGEIHEGCYYAAYTGPSSGSHNRLLELYLNLPVNGEKQHPWMAHDLACKSLASMPNGDLVFADAEDPSFVRLAFSGAADVTGDGTSPADLNDIVALARTGMLNFEVIGQLSVRRIVAFGHGRCTISTISNDGTQESKSFSMPLTVDTWNPAESWGGTWSDGGASPVRSDMAYYTRSGRFIAFEIVERSQTAGPPAQVLGEFSGSDEGGMKITGLQVTITPLDNYL